MKDEEGIGGWVVQHYLDQPHCIDDLKYDLRIYVLVNCVNPLRIYIHEEGLARFCTEPYRKPTARNLDNLYMHLTNYAINKFSDAYAQGDEESGDEESGHKRSLKAIMKILQLCGADSEKLYSQIKDIIVKTVAAGQPYISHLYRSCQPEDLEGSMCFQILGFDIMIDKFFKPWLIEVNQSPSFATESPLDYKTKKAVLTDTFNMLNCSIKKRKQINKQQQEQMESRILTGKQAKLEPEEKAKLKEEKQSERFRYEEKRKGQWELILPWPDEQRNNKLNEIISRAQDIWDEFTTGKGKKTSHNDDKRGPNNSNMSKGINTAAALKNNQHAKATLSNAGSNQNLRQTKPLFNRAVPQNEVIFNSMAARVAVLTGTNFQCQGAPRINIGQQMHIPSPGQLGNNSIGVAKRFPQQPQSGPMQTRNNNNGSSVKNIGQATSPGQTASTNHHIIARKRPSMNLDVIEQQTQESGGVTLVSKNSMGLAYDSSMEQIIANHQHHHQQKYKLKLIGNQVAAASNDPVMDHLKLLTKPANQHHREKSLMDQQILQQRIEAEKRRIKSYINPNLVTNGMAGEKNLKHSDSKSSFMQRQIEAHQHIQEQQLMQQSEIRSRDRLSPKASAMSTSGLQQYRQLNEDRASNLKITSYNTVGTSDGISGQKTMLPESQGDAAAQREYGSQLRKSPGSNNGSSEGRSSLQMAGSEQLNFMMASNYPAKMNIEQFRQQVMHLSHDQQQLISQAYQQSGMHRVVPFTSAMPNGSALPSAIMVEHPPLTSPGVRATKQPYTTVSQPQSKLLTHKGTEVFDSLRQLDKSEMPIGAEIAAFSEKSRKSHALTEQKVQQVPSTSLHHQQVTQQPNTLRPVDSLLARHSNLKLTSKGANELNEDIGDVEDLKATTVGRTSGFPQVMQQFKESSDAVNFALAQKKAVKMTQMPLFIEETNHLSHRNMLMKKETPRQQFKNLPGINSNNDQPMHPSEMMGSRPTLKADVSQTVARSQAKKLESSSTLQKSLHNGHLGSGFHNSAQVQKNGIKPMPSYQNVLAGGQDPIEDVIYFQRHGNVYQNSSSGREKQQQVGRSIQGSLAGNGSKKVNMQPHTMYGNTNVSDRQPTRYQVGASGDGVREKRQTTTMTSTGNQINNNITGKAKAAQLTPFQLYQQLQQQQQIQQRSKASDFPTASFKPRYAQQQLIGQVQQQQQQQQQQQARALGGGGAQSQQQQNQILLNNNQQSRPQQQQKFQSQPSRGAAVGGANAAAAIAAQSNNAPQLRSPQNNGGYQHPTRVLTGTQTGNYNPQSSAKNRRLGRALGQGKSVGVGGGGVGRGHQKSRGYANNGGLNISNYEQTSGQGGPTGSSKGPTSHQKQLNHQQSQSMGQTQPAWIRSADMNQSQTQQPYEGRNTGQTISNGQSRANLGTRPKRKAQ